MTIFNQYPDEVSVLSRFQIQWSKPGVGFGQFEFYENNGVIYCDNETMSRDFIKTILCDMVDRSILDSESEC